MEKISKSVEDAIKGAIKLEIEGRKFFNHAADVTEHERGRRMFRFLADEEVKHMERFGQLFSQILGGSDWRKVIDPSQYRGAAPMVDKLKERMKKAKGKSEVEALSIGMQLESDAIKFFQNASADTDDPVAKKIFHEISEEEKFHYDLLQAQYDSVNKTGNWLDGAEFQMDGKW
ncbi:MAG: ferritin family protein [Candidatus Aminicenantes bacterium]